LRQNGHFNFAATSDTYAPERQTCPLLKPDRPLSDPWSFAVSNDRASHWETIYRAKADDQVSWFQQTPEPSLTLLGLVECNAWQRQSSTSAPERRIWSTCLIGQRLWRRHRARHLAGCTRQPTARASDRTPSRVTWIRSDVTAW
jgi:hypothetical protein